MSAASGTAWRGTAAVSPLGGILTVAAALLTFAAVAVLFLVSPDVLASWGFSYGSPQGSPLGKIHPATWIVFAALATTAIASGRPLRWFDDKLARSGGAAVFGATLVLVMIYTIVVRHVPFTPLVDTFASPLALFLLLIDLPSTRRERLAQFVHLVLFANALIATYEFATGWRMTPVVAEGIEVVDWRSSALLGHPLANAAVTGCYVLVLLSAKCRGMPSFLKAPALLAQLVAMVAFGGRTAMVLLGMMLLVLSLVGGWRLLRGRRVGLTQLAAVAVTVPIAAAGIAALADFGFFDKFADRFVDDNGSTLARIGIAHVLEALSFQDVLLGVDLDRVSTLQRQEGLEFGIESFWINFAVIYGLGVSLIFYGGFFCFMRELLRASAGRALPMLALFLGTATTGVSLSAKTMVLGITVALVLLMLRSDGPMGPRRPQHVPRRPPAGPPTVPNPDVP